MARIRSQRYLRSLRRRRATRQRRYNRRSMMVPRSRFSQSGMLNVKRTFWLELWSPNSVTTNGFWRYYQPTFANLPSNAEFKALFDLYKIRGIKFTLRPKWDNFGGNDLTVNGTTNAGHMMVSYIVDSKQGIAPGGTYNSTTYNSFCEYGNVKQVTGTRTISVYFKPSVQSTIQGLATTPMYNKWITTIQDAINHKGIHFFVNDQNFSGQFTQSYDVFVTYYMQFKGTR